ncbi:Bacteroidetes-specific Putative membrane protein [Croceitalea dokdonensis DOKDO 023]|uniref:Bacteroidetes-specific Putative membrane protein n=1 Tax=Croceitalea dokdonensis DOKDO 023 TaxID=1300341 RepID=A0A0P7ANQ3_9FLAO|nr:PorP/SprF family type IX secretion system membrane protein [Croceitalea dokdonensis]KPM30701.1 Bacteroidetes-specific Putative membrane protein [Croceitalea dokdonensis DOKDO 023]
MKKKYISYLILELCFCGMVIAQQTPSFTEYNYNPFMINSAFAGIFKNSETTLSNIGFGNQDFEGSPRSFAFTFNSPMRNEKMGMGFGIVSDEIGVTSSTQIFGAYSYKIILNDNAYPYWKVFDRSFISFGLNAGALLYSQDLLSLGLQDDPNFMENVNATLPAVGAGVLFGYRNFFAGISAPNLLGDTFANQDNLVLSQPFYGYTGYHFVLDRYDPKFILKPSLLFKYENGAPFQIDTNLALSFKNIIELGAGFRTSDTINAFLGCYVFKNFRLIYSYSQGSGDSPLRNTHGIILSYRAGKGYSID